MTLRTKKVLVGAVTFAALYPLSYVHAEENVVVESNMYSIDGEITAYDGDYNIIYGGNFDGTGELPNSGASPAVKNHVTINSANVNGGIITNGVIGGATLNRSAYGNSVIVNDGEISGGIYGGIVNNPTENSFISDNTINIYGGTISGNVVAAQINGTGSGVNVTGNTINIFGSPNLSNASLYGISGSNYTSSNNLLNIYTSGLTAQNIANFDGVNFYMPYEVQSGDRILTLTGNTTNLGLDKIRIQMHGDSALTTGDTIGIIYNSNGIDASSTNYDGLAMSADGTGGVSYDGVITRGSTAVYGLNLATSADGTELTASVGDLIGDTGNPIPESSRDLLASIPMEPPDPFTEMTLDRIEGTFGDADIPDGNNASGNSNAEDTTSVRDANGFNIFFNSGGGRIKSRTGGGTWMTTTRGYYDLGFARSLDSKYGTWFIAPLFEYSHGNYDSQLSQNIKGHGSTKYMAGGFMARRLNNNGFYYEASFRAGRTESDFVSNDFIIDGEPARVTYEMQTPVFTGHVRLGVAKKLNANNLLDIYGIYCYAHQNSMSSDLSSGEHVDFSAVHASKMRLGYRFTTRTSAISRVYTGLAWQHESNSDATASAIDYQKHTDGSKGSSGMLELGWQIKPNRNNPWLLDLNATGWIGYQRGFNMTARMQRSI